MRPASIVEARFNLTRRQNDILDMVFASIENDNKLQYDVDINKYAKLYSLKDKSSIYSELKKAVKSFEGKGFAIVTKINEKKEDRDYFAWFSHIKYRDGEGKITVELGQTLKQILLEVKRVVYYKIEYSLNLNSIYSKRLYYYLKLYEDTGSRFDNLDILRDKLECPKSYQKYSLFRRNVLEPAYEEINGNSDISFDYEEIKTKNKVTGINFKIKTNKLKIKTNKPKISNADEEVSATLIEPEKENSIKKIMSIMSDSKITALEAKKLNDTANGDINIIKDKYSQAQKVTKIDSVVGWMLKAIKENYQAPKSRSKNGDFNNYEQRDYDFDKLEKKLLGWDDEEEIPSTGEEFIQSHLKNIIAVQ